MPFHSPQHKFCSVHTFHESSGGAAEMIKITISVIYTPLFGMDELKFKTLGNVYTISRLLRGEFENLFYF